MEDNQMKKVELKDFLEYNFLSNVKMRLFFII